MSNSKRDTAIYIIDHLVQAGFASYLVGGCVRDEFLGIHPNDYDVATSATPGQVKALFPKVIEVGAAFGVQMVIHNGHSIEVATFRGDGAYSDGRRPDTVSFTDAKGDVARRDFTINGMMSNPATGELLDFVGGQNDLEAKIVRAIGDPATRFDEDHLRLLRAVRFAARLSFDIEPRTANAIKKLAHKIVKVSAERIGEELTIIFTGANPQQGLELLVRLKLLPHILPEVAAMVGVKQSPKHHPEGDVFQHTLAVLSNLPDNPSPTLAWAALLHDIGKPPCMVKDPKVGWRFTHHDTVGADMAARVLQRLKRPKALVEGVKKLVGNHMFFLDLQQRKPAKLKRLLLRDDIEDLLLLHKADALGSDGVLDHYDFGVAQLHQLRNEPPPTQPLLTGADLMALGFTPGPAFKTILFAVETAMLNGEIHTRDEAIALVLKTYSLD